MAEQVQKNQSAVKGNNTTPATNGAEEDSVTQDINKFKKYYAKFTAQIKSAFVPFTSKIKPAVETATSEQTKEKADKFMSNFTKVAIFIVIIFVTLLLVMIGVSIVQKFNGSGSGNGGRGGGNGEENGEVVVPLPSIVPYIPSQPSIYASDTVILKLE